MTAQVISWSFGYTICLGLPRGGFILRSMMPPEISELIGSTAPPGRSADEF